jgi:hypothetical protein
VIQPAAYGAWADYQPTAITVAAARRMFVLLHALLPSLLCIIPDTVARSAARLTACSLRPTQRTWPGITCTRGSGCASISCSGGCPSCGGPAVGNPFQDDEPMPLPPKAAQETRRAPAPRTLREHSTALSMAREMTTPRPATRSVLTRAPRPAEQDVSRAEHTAPAVKKSASVVKRTAATIPSANTTQSARRSTDTHNPLRWL